MGLETTPKGTSKTPEPKNDSQEIDMVEFGDYLGEEFYKLRQEFVGKLGRTALDIITEWDEKSTLRKPSKVWADYLIQQARTSLEDRV